MLKYTNEMRSFIIENVKGHTCKELVQLFNNKFDTELTENQMMSYKKNHKLKSETSRGGVIGRATELYPQEVKDFIKDNYIGNGPTQMAKILNEKFSKSYTKSQIKSYYGNNKISSGVSGHFKLGQKPINPFRKGQRASIKTEYKSGSKPHNYVPIGTERVNVDGYTDIKVQDNMRQKNWKGKHIIIWEKHNGKIPEGHVIVFGDRDKSNFDINNLLLVSRKQLLVMNRNNLIQDDTELTKLGIVVSSMKLKISEKEKK